MPIRRKSLPLNRRRAIFERDGGKCQKCGFNIGAAIVELGLYRAALYIETGQVDRGIVKCFAEVLYGNRARNGSVRWQIHHRKPVAEGGSDEDSNLELVCVAPECHPKETAKQAKRKALRRRYGTFAKIPESLK